MEGILAKTQQQHIHSIPFLLPLFVVTDESNSAIAASFLHGWMDECNADDW